MEVDGSVTHTDNAVLFTPDLPLEHSGTYTALLAEGITSADGSLTADGLSWSFMVRDRQWGSAVQLNLPDGYGIQKNDSHLAAAEDGTIFAFWDELESDHTTRKLYTARFKNDVWTEPEPLSTSNGSVSGASIGTDSSGNAVVVWKAYDSGIPSTDLWTADYSEAGGWTAAAQLRTAVDTPQLAVDSDGNAMAVWEASGDILCTYRPSGGGWSGDIDTEDDSGTSPLITTIGDNVFLVFWRQGNSVYCREYDGSTTSWAAAAVEINAGSNSQAPYTKAVHSRQDGTAVAVWVQGDNKELWFSTYSSGTWQTDQRITTTEDTIWEAAIILNADGDCFAAWINTVDSQDQAWCAYRPAGSAWQGRCPPGFPDRGRRERHLPCGQRQRFYGPLGPRDRHSAEHPGQDIRRHPRGCRRPGSRRRAVPVAAMTPDGNALVLWTTSVASGDPAPLWATPLN